MRMCAYVYAHVCMCVYVCTCVCMCACVREGESDKCNIFSSLLYVHVLYKAVSFIAEFFYRMDAHIGSAWLTKGLLSNYG